MSPLLLDPVLDDLAPPEAAADIEGDLFTGPVLLIVQTPSTRTRPEAVRVLRRRPDLRHPIT